MTESKPPSNPAPRAATKQLALGAGRFPGALLLVLFMVAVSVRGIGFMARHEYNIPATVGAEAGVIAQHIVHGQGFSSPFASAAPGSPSVHLPPAYPYFLAGLMKAGLSERGEYYTAVAVNLIVSGLLPVIALLIGQAAGFPMAVSLIAAMAMCFCPEALRAVGLVWDEALFVTFSAAMIWWMIRRFGAGPRLGDSAWLGAASGVLALLNPAMVLALPAAWLSGLGAMRVRWKLLAAHACIFAGFTLAGSAPWNIRNWFVLRPPAYVFIRGNFWLEVWSSLHPVSRVVTEGGSIALEPLHPWNGTELMEKPDAKGVEHRLSEQAYDAWCRQRAVAEFRLHPSTLWKHVAVEFNAFWVGIAEARRWQRNAVLFFLAQGLPALLGLIGLVVSRRRLRRPVWAAFVAVLIVFPLPYYLAGGGMRYRHPIDVVLYLGVGWLAWALMERAGADRGAGGGL